LGLALPHLLNAGFNPFDASFRVPKPIDASGHTGDHRYKIIHEIITGIGEIDDLHPAALLL
jgi:hypothetical protein